MKKKSKTKKTAKKKSQAKGSRSAPSLHLNSQIWPLEKDILFRPDRYKYVRKLVVPEGCVFCLPAKGEPSFENLCVYKTKHSMVVVNKFPYNSGHVLVLPQRHCGDLLDLPEAEYVDLQHLVRTTVKALKEVYKPAGFNIGLNHGAVAGAGIPEHLHYHIIPRWAGDLNFFPLIAETKVVVESLEQSFERLLRYFNESAAV